MDYQSSAPAAMPTSTMAIISLVAGILGFTLFPFIGSIIAIVTGMMARGETRAVPPRASGDGMATAGIIMGWIGVGLGVCGLCFGIALFVLPFFGLVLFSLPSNSSALLLLIA